MKTIYDTLDIDCEDEDCKSNILAVARYLNEVGREGADINTICAILAIKRSVYKRSV